MSQRVFIDLFAGCGGFSLGFVRAGWHGLFAIEQNASAFKTFSRNLLEGKTTGAFDWPDWLPKKAHNIRTVLREHPDDLRALQGSVDLVIGGPPCQGFSFAGIRKRSDRRNSLYKAYLEFVQLLRPRFVLIENVRGITVEHGKKERMKRKHKAGRPALSYSKRIVRDLEAAGYSVNSPRLINASDFGVPQRRPRVFFFAQLKGPVDDTIVDLFKVLYDQRPGFLETRGLPTSRPIHVVEAISDLLRGHGATVCDDSASPKGFELGLYGGAASSLQKLLRNGHRSGSAAQSHRFAKHRPATVKRFAKIQNECRRGVQLHKEDLKAFGMSKHVVVPLRGDQVSHTLTTLPDDYIHYSEPRILTVREYARLQTFPDSFCFDGPFTTGGDRRRSSCPRYTQIGNAVPPLLSEAIALALLAATRVQ